MESAPVTTAPFQFKWQGIAQHVYDEYLSNPYTSPTIPNDWEYTHGDVTIPRPNHSLTHTLRTAAYVSEVVKAYNCFHKPPLTSKDIDQIQIALLFYVVGRENEASFGNPEYLRYRQKSADAFEKYVRNHLPAQFTEAELQFYKTGIYNAYSNAPAEYIIIRICHDLDLIRCYTRDKYNEKLKEAAVHIGPHATPLAELAEECLQRTGDRIMDKRTYEGPLFIRCSTSVEAALQKINEAFQHKQGVIMQPVQPSPIPPDLRPPIPETPWNISDPLWRRMQNQPSDPASHLRKCEVLQTDEEMAFVIKYFFYNKPDKYGIKKIHCIHHPTQTALFENGVKAIEDEVNNPKHTFLPKWMDEEPKADRARVIDRWKKCTAPFSPVEIQGNKRKDVCTEVKVLPLWHGSDETKCQSICASGFTFFGKHHVADPTVAQGANASTDSGYFGSGIYFTNSARYAALYSQGHLLLSWVSMREPYPVVNSFSHPRQGEDMMRLKGKGAYHNYNAHYIPVASLDPSDPTYMQYYPCYQNQMPDLDEIVVFNKCQTLPRFWIELGPDSLPLKNPFSASAAPTAPASTTPALVPKTASGSMFKKKSLVPKTAPTAPASTTPALVPKTAPLSGIASIIANTKAGPEPAKAVPTAPALVPKAAPYIAAVTPPTAKPVVLPLVPFGKKAWETYFGDVGVEPPLPPDIEQILSAPCPFVGGKKVFETHLLVLVPQTVSGRPLTLKTLGELVQKPQKPGNPTKYSQFTLGQYTDPAAPPSHWVLMTRDVIKGSRSSQSYQAQKALLNQKAGDSYAVPNVLDATVCIFMEHIRTGTRLYSNSPYTYTRCQEKYDANWQLVVGGFALPGPDVYHDYDSADENCGVAGLRKF